MYSSAKVGFPGMCLRRKGIKAFTRKSPVPAGEVLTTTVIVLPW